MSLQPAWEEGIQHATNQEFLSARFGPRDWSSLIGLSEDFWRTDGNSQAGLRVPLVVKIPRDIKNDEEKQSLFYMLQTLAIILIVAWLLGMVSSYTMGGFIHILLVVAVVLILVRLIQGKRIT